jgi:hypothetical protein
VIATARLDEKGTARRFDRAVPSLLCAGDAALEVNPDVGRLFLWWDRTWLRRRPLESRRAATRFRLGRWQRAGDPLRRRIDVAYCCCAMSRSKRLLLIS